MAASVFHAPGSELGPCAGACGHRDCAATRAMADALCVRCYSAIGYGVRFYEVSRSDDGTVRHYAHASCHEEGM
jgi:hypothetical protein